LILGATLAAPSLVAARVLQQIKAEHRALLQVIGAMQALIAAWRARGAKPPAEVFEAMLRYIETVPDRLHHPQEDEVLFPAIAQRSRQGRELILRLTREHARGERMISDTRAALARLDAAGPRALEGLATAVEELAEFTWWHIHREEEQLLPIAQAVLPESAWKDIAAAFARA
jgi:hemerythrin-like domain-containing protein